MWVIAQEVLKLPVIAQELLNNNDLYGYSARSTKRRPYKACSARSTIIIKSLLLTFKFKF